MIDIFGLSSGLLVESPSRPSQPGEVNYALDAYTLAHFASGVLLGYTPLKGAAVLLVSCAFEVIEPLMQDIFWDWRQTDTREGVINIIVDVLAVMGGWALARRARGLRVDVV